jgi:circadian clock protein KaiC
MATARPGGAALEDGDSTAPEVFETGVPNLDRILGGGIQRRAIAMVIGAPGTGKTILAEQIVFTHASRGATTLFLTGYSETHDKLLSHARGFSFFRRELIGRQIQFASLPDLLREGPDETESAIVAMTRDQRATLVVLDGFRSMRGFLTDNHEAAHFVYSLGAKLALLGATTLLLVEGDPDEQARYPEMTVCDVILALSRENAGSRGRRLLHMLKARGANPLIGTHPFIINQDGLSIFPRFESVVTATEPAWMPGRAAFGIADLDAIIEGGLTRATVTLAAGSPGVGKTTLGLHFMSEGIKAGEPGLFLGFMESPAQLREKAHLFGMDLSTAEATNLVRLLVLPDYDLEVDAIATALAQDIERRGVRRLVIDSAAVLERALAIHPERISDFLAALAGYLRGREVTTYMTLEVPVIVGPQLEFTGSPLAMLAENLLIMRMVEYRGRLHQVLSVLKMRFSGYERAIYEFGVAPGRGLHIVGPAPLGEGLLTGVPRVPTESWARSEPGGGQGAPWPQS